MWCETWIPESPQSQAYELLRLSWFSVWREKGSNMANGFDESARIQAGTKLYTESMGGNPWDM